MKGFLAKINALLLLVPTIAVAGWQVATPQNTTMTSNDPFFQAGMRQGTTFSSYGNSAFPNQSSSLGNPATIYAISVSGSLKENIERIMDRYHWKVVWKAPYDYNFDGRVTGSSLPNVIEKLLQPFPLQAQMYMSNRIMTVTTRKV